MDVASDQSVCKSEDVVVVARRCRGDADDVLVHSFSITGPDDGDGRT